MLHHAVRPLLRVAILSVLLGLAPSAPTPIVRATPHRTLAVADSPVPAATPPTPVTQPVAPESSPLPHPEAPPPSIPAHASVSTTDTSHFGKLPLSFVPNVGQVDSAVRYHVRGMGGSIFFTPQEVVLALPTDAHPRRSHDPSPSIGITSTLPITMSIVRIRYEGAGANPTIAAANRLPGTVNYFTGNDPAQWHTNLPIYDGIV